MSTPGCSRLWRIRLFEPDCCTCLWSNKTIRKSLARIQVGLDEDVETMNRWAALSALFVEIS